MIKIDNLAYGYDNIPIVSNLNLNIEKGDYVAIVGKNGAGKTTLMKTLLGLLKPIEGTITFTDGLKHTDIGYLPQQTVVQKDFPASVYEIVLSGFQNKLGLRPFYNKKEKAEAIENIKKMGIENLKDKCYKNLSGGQQQRVLLARAMCASKNIILLDEPTVGLDKYAIDNMYNLINELNKNGTTVIMISHDIEMAKKYAKHILYISEETYFGTVNDFERKGIEL